MQSNRGGGAQIDPSESSGCAIFCYWWTGKKTRKLVVCQSWNLFFSKSIIQLLFGFMVICTCNKIAFKRWTTHSHIFRIDINGAILECPYPLLAEGNSQNNPITPGDTSELSRAISCGNNLLRPGLGAGEGRQYQTQRDSLGKKMQTISSRFFPPFTNNACGSQLLPIQAVSKSQNYPTVPDTEESKTRLKCTKQKSFISEKNIFIDRGQVEFTHYRIPVPWMACGG